MTVLSIRVDDDLDRRLSREAERDGQPKSELAREAITRWLDERERQRFVASIARAARAIDPERARAIAEEALHGDNAALVASEPAAGKYRAAATKAERRRARR